MLRKLWGRLKAFFVWLFKQLKDKTNIVIFFSVFLVLSYEVWIPYLIAIITGIEWWWAVGSACRAFRLASFTPFVPLCLALTAAVRKIYDKIKNKKRQGVKFLSFSVIIR